VANRLANNVAVLLNNGDGTFAARSTFGVGSSPRSVFSADLDGDNDNDLAVANLESDDISILLNNGDGTFAAAIAYVVGDGPESIWSGDLDGDNVNDLAVVNGISNDVSILLNDGAGTFTLAADYGTGDGPRAIFSADLDGDNDNDLAIANSGSANVSVLLNLNKWGTIPATAPAPDTMLLIYARSVTPFEVTSHLGHFDPGFNAADVNTATLSINSTIDPVSAVVIPDHPAFDGEVLEIVFYATEFIDGYGLLFDITAQPYTVTGEYFDGSPFEAVGKVVIVAHRSGDVNADGAGPNIADLTYLVDYLFKNGAPPPVPAAANVDGSNSLTVADITYMVDYLFAGGPTPNCQPIL